MKWLDLSGNEREAALQSVAERLDIDTPSVEKDWWVTTVLRYSKHRLLRICYSKVGHR